MLDSILGITALILGIFIFVFWLPKRKRTLKHYRDLEEEKRKLEQRHSKERAEDWMVEMTELGREINAKIDNKISMLKELLNELDSKINYYNSLKEENTTPPPKVSKPPSNENTPASQHQIVFELQDKGMSKEEIAQKTSQPIGEIELILGLRGKSA